MFGFHLVTETEKTETFQLPVGAFPEKLIVDLGSEKFSCNLEALSYYPAGLLLMS